MAIYTCIDMIGDCRADKPEGWRYLIAQYVPVIRQYVAHYYPAADAEALTNEALLKLKNPRSPLFAAPGAATEREFAAALRQAVTGILDADPGGGTDAAVDLETMTAALEPLTAMERQMLWMEGMAYTPEEAGKLLNLEPSTIRKLRERADELLRGKMDRWEKGVVARNGKALGRQAAAARGESCLSAKACLDTLDGRITWKRKQDYDHHLAHCWHCVDFFSRLRESDFVLRSAKPLTGAENARHQALLGVVEEEKPFWKKMLAR